MGKTREEIHRLKMDWAGDPCWDIEDTEDFEEYRDELLKYRLDREEAQCLAEIERKTRRCAELGIADFRLLDYLESLELRIVALQEQLAQVQSDTMHLKVL